MISVAAAVATPHRYTKDSVIIPLLSVLPEL